MSTPLDPQREYPSTYFVQDYSIDNELTRLQIQSQMLTASMGGVLAEQTDPASFRNVLDVGCGTGDWLIDVAKAYPDIPRLIGVDINSKMLDYARTEVAAQHLSDRIEFATMDTLRMLEFPNDFFDLVNQRLGFSFLRTWDWPRQLREFRRVTAPGGIIRVTEPALAGGSTSPALRRLSLIQLQSFFQAGYFFVEEGDGVIRELPRLLQQHCNLPEVQAYKHKIEYVAGTPQGTRFFEDMKHLFRTAIPFYRKWTTLPENYDEIFQQMLVEVQQADFVGNVTLLTAWGQKE